MDDAGDNGSTALMIASRNGQMGAVRLLLKHHAEVNYQNGNGLTALEWALKNGNTDIAEVLRQAGAQDK